MKTTRQQTGKVVEARQKHNASAGSIGVKRSRNRTSEQHQKQIDPGIFPFTTAQELCWLLPSRSKSFPEATKEVPAFELKTGLVHPSTKIKLQLFPIYEGTRIGLEKDGHNPFLELTLRARKKISSVLKHINTKWGSSSVALGEPMLFPYNAWLKNLSTDRRWTLNDTGISARDVHVAIGSPAIFRLRYGWFSNLEPKIHGVPSTSTLLDTCLESEGTQKGCSITSEFTYDQWTKLELTSEENEKATHIGKAVDTTMTELMSLDVQVDHVDDEVKIDDDLARPMVPWDDNLTNLSIGGLLSEASLQGKIDNCDLKPNECKSGLQPTGLITRISMGGLLSESSLLGRTCNQESTSNGSKAGLQPTVDRGLSQSLFPWDDSLTNLSIGGLLSEASLQGKIKNCDPKSNGSKSGFQQTTLLISDSFDAFIASQINTNSQAAKPSSLDSHSSILDAEETCHAFPFQKLSSFGKDDVASSGRASSGVCSHDARSNSFKFPNSIELNGQAGLVQNPVCQEAKTDLLPRSRRVYTEDSSLGLTGIKWNDSLGPFDLGLSTVQQVTGGDGISISEFVA